MSSSKFRLIAWVYVAAGLVLASPMATASAWTNNVTVTSFEVTSDGTFFQINGPWSTTDGCTNYTWGAIPNGTTNLSLLTTVLYDAYINGNTVSLYSSGCYTQNAGSTYPAVMYVRVNKS